MNFKKNFSFIFKLNLIEIKLFNFIEISNSSKQNITALKLK